MEEGKYLIMTLQPLSSSTRLPKTVKPSLPGAEQGLTHLSLSFPNAIPFCTNGCILKYIILELNIFLALELTLILTSHAGLNLNHSEV